MSCGGQHGTCPIMFYRKTRTFYHILHVLFWWSIFIIGSYGFTPLKFRIQEGLPVDYIVGTVSTGDSLPHQYEIYGGSNPYFTLELKSGVLKTNTVIDREQLSEISIKLLVIVDGGTNGYIQVGVDIIDINDNTPVFPQSFITLAISESTGINQKRSLQPATDPDLGVNSTQEYKIVSGNDYHYFRLQYNIASVDTLLLVINKTLDRESTPIISLNVSCCDGGIPSLCGYFILNITIIDVNDNSPVFIPQNYKVEVNESITAGTPVIKVNASDLDAGDNAAITYNIDRRPGSDDERYFSIDAKSGWIITNGRLDHEVQSSHNIIVLAKDGGVPQRTGRGYVTVNVLDRNDNAPKINVIYFITGSYQTMENSQINTHVARILVTDKDKGHNGKLDVSILSGGGYFQLEAETNDTYILKVSKIIDRELVPQIKVVIIAKDHGTPQLKTEKELIINVGDENDNTPLFVDMPGSIVIHENVRKGKDLLIVNTTDADVGINSQVTYSITTVTEAAKQWFTIDDKSGLIRTNSGIDRETIDFVNLKITAEDMGNTSLSSTANLNITILDDNDHSPQFANSSFVAKVYENAKIGTEIGLVQASDDDDPALFGKIRYSLSDPQSFEIDPIKGVVKTSKLLDRETKDVYSFDIVATDGGGISTQISALVSILDVDDNSPKFDKRVYNFSIPENLPVGAVAGVINAVDIDIGVNAAKRYSIETQDDPNPFFLNPTTGSIKISQPLDRSKNIIYKMTISVQGIRGNPSMKDIARVSITILEANLNPPYFEQSSYNLTMKENQSIPYTMGVILAQRDNFGIDKHLNYFLESIKPPDLKISINTSGAIICNSIIDYEVIQSIQFLLKATDKSDKSISSNTTVHIFITDINDNAPQFDTDKLTIHINEGLPLGHVIYNTKTIDKDSGINGDVTYSIKETNTPFVIDPKSADIITNSTIDYEEKTNYTFVVIAIDHGVPSLRSSLIVNVIIEDVNDNAPMFKEREFYADVSEAVKVGYHIMNISVTDRDSQQNGIVSLELEQSLHSEYFELTSNGMLSVKKKLDRETISEFAFQISAKDNGTPQLISKATVYVFVLDENDNSPIFDNGDGKYVFPLFEEKLPGSTVGAVSASDEDTGSNGFVTYRLRDSSEQFHVNSMTGLITTKIVLDRETMTSSYRLIIIAFDGGEVSKTASASITINLIDTNDNMPVFSQDEPYFESIIEDNVVGEHILTASASDDDFALSGQVRYSLVGMNEKENNSLSHFKIDPISGLLTLRTKVFYNPNHFVHKFSVKATDLGTPSLLSFHKIFIYVLPKSTNRPLFDKQSIDIMINEKDAIGTVVTTIQVMRSEMSRGKAWEYKIKSGNTGDSFYLHSATGILETKSPLTFAGLQSYQLEVVATEKRTNAKDQIFVNILVLEKNENWPLFLVNPIVGVLYENLPNGSPLSTVVNATDKDQSTDVSLFYSIVSQSPGLPSFKIEPFTGVIRTIKEIDRESVPEWSLTIMAKDLACNQSMQLNSTATMRLVVLDLNDNPPIFQSKNYTYMMEDEPPGYPVMTVIATDADQGDNAEISYKIISGNDEAKFEINMISGEITLTEPLIHNTKKSYYLTVKATDGGLKPLSNTASIHIDIIDVNNDRPKFTQSKYVASVSENLPIGSTVFQVKANDLDTGLNGLITYSMEDNDAVEINADSGVITTKMSLDREIRSEYILSVSAQDNSYPFRSDFASMRIKVDDVNDCKPEFLSGLNVTISVLENQKELSGIHTFTASDDDIGINAKVLYILQSTFGNLFELNNITGSLSVTDVLDRETKESYSMRVIARNSEAPYAEAHQDVIVKVVDVNDNYPEFDSHEYKRTIPEDTPVNTTILTLHATDKDAGINGAVTYSLPKRKNGNGTLLGKFDINPATGNIYTIAPLDYESQKVYYFLVQASDQALHDTREKSVTVTITITDVNDNAPVFDHALYTATVETAKQNDVILTVSAVDIDSGVAGIVEYDLVLPNTDFIINKVSGELSTKRDLPPANYRLTAIARDQGIPKSLYSEVVVIITVGQSFLHTPQFLNASLTFELPENSKHGTILGIVLATTSPPSIIEYRLGNMNTSKVPFVINSQTGVISVSQSEPLDYEKTHIFLFGVVAVVKGNETLSNYMSGQVNLIDTNDNTPVITPSKLSVQLAETTRGDPSSVNMYIAQFTVSDADRGNNSRISFGIVSGNERGHFSIFTEDGILISKDGLDYELQKSYTLLIEARDNGVPSRASHSVVTISVTDKNDNPPVLSKYGPLPISEVTRPGTVLLIVHAYDLDETGVIRYSILDQNLDDTFSIDPVKGAITLLDHLDYETKRQYTITVQADDGVFKSQTTITVNVVDHNDNVPEFDQPGYYFYLPELLSRNSLIGRVNATDRDAGLYGSVRYSLSPSVADAFVIDQSSGQIYTTKQIVLDPAARPLQLIVTASDSGTPPRISSTTVRLRVNDPSYNGPKFTLSSYSATVPEDAKIGASVGSVVATSTIPDMYILYNIKSGNDKGRFNIDARSGIIHVNASLDREVDHQYHLVIAAQDRETKPRAATVYLNVTVTDANDHLPVFELKRYTVKVYENITIGTSLLRVKATDLDDPATPNGVISYSIQSGNSYSWFSINKTSGDIFVTRPLDRETLAVHRLSVKASDEGVPARSSAVSVSIHLLDVNDNTPVFSLDAPQVHLLKVDENVPNNSVVFKAVARDEDASRNGMISYSIIGGDGTFTFYIDPDTGWVYSRQSIDFEQKSLYTLIVEAADFGVPSLKASFEYSIAVNDLNEFTPYFRSKTLQLNVSGNTPIGKEVGLVSAVDEDGGEAGEIFYSFQNPQDEFFKIEQLTGVIVVNRDIRKNARNRARRSADENYGQMSYTILADNGPNTAGQTMTVSIAVDYTCPGCVVLKSLIDEKGDELKGWSLILVSIICVIAGIIFFAFLLFICTKRRRKKRAAYTTERATIEQLYDHADNSNQQNCLDHKIGPNAFRELLRPSYDDPSLYQNGSTLTSSGCASFDSHLRNGIASSGCPGQSILDNKSTHSFDMYQAKPTLDSGIQQDIDHRLSDMTITETLTSLDSRPSRKSNSIKRTSGKAFLMESHESLYAFEEEGGGEAGGGMDVANLLYAKLADVDADEQDAIMDGTRPFQEEGALSHGGSLSTIVGSEEELRGGSYNWGSMLNWKPQFKPLKAMFTELAQMKTTAPTLTHDIKTNSNRNMPDLSTRVPLLSSFEQHGAQRSIDSQSNRTSLLSSVSSLPRSPISIQSNYTSAAMSPSFTPAITPMVNRSPSVSPLGSPERMVSPQGSKTNSILDIASGKDRKKRIDLDQTHFGEIDV